ncbi:MAG: coniferyl aldehyde dehydrogenase [Pseudomonadota bacterium]
MTSPVSLHASDSSANNNEKIKTLFETMQGLSRSKAPLDYHTRRQHLDAIKTLLKTHGEELVASVFRDYRGRSVRETLLAEIFPTLSCLQFTRKNLRKWMRPQSRRVPLTFWPAKNKVHYQPKGVVLIISPWNYPINLTLIPLIEAIAAGNRVIIKPSETTQKTSKAFATLISKYFSEDHVAVVTGDADVSRMLTTLPFDHIFFTGSTHVGRSVMKAAAENLVPVTLELGGKSPVIIHDSYELKQAATRIAIGKLLNAGQTCIAPDYVLLPEQKCETFKALYQETVANLYPKLAANADYTPIVNQHHFDRLKALLSDAKAKGAKVITIDPASEMAEHKQRKFAPTLVTHTNDDMKVMQEEIFGPILPLIPYKTLDDAIAYVNGQERPLALYYFDRNTKRIRHVLEHTVSGGVTLNDTLFHVAQDDLHFGGIGSSGMGAYHGFTGFKTFSHAKSVFYQSSFSTISFLNPPYGKRFDRIIKTMMALKGR